MIRGVFDACRGRTRSFALLILVAGGCAGQTVTGYNGVTVSVAPAGSWSLSLPGPGWQFAGSTGAGVSFIRANSGVDVLGAWKELAFDYAAPGSRTASIRTYAASPIVLFSIVYNDMADTTNPFPVISSYPSLAHVSFSGMFAGFDFTNLVADSPWVFFDKAANAFILSPASNFMTAATSKLANGAIASGISSKIASLPAGFTHRVALVFGTGINQAFADWGKALTSLGGKVRPANNEGPLLKSISYWTDNGATYYYNPGSGSYTECGPGRLGSQQRHRGSRGWKVRAPSRTRPYRSLPVPPIY